MSGGTSNDVSKNVKSDYDRAKNRVMPWFLPFNNLVTYHGLENVIEEGPNIIIGNHPGVGKDIAGLLKAYNRQLHFTASDFLFSKETMIAQAKEYLGNGFCGNLQFKLLKPLINIFSDFLPPKMEKYEMIPITLRNNLSRDQVVSYLKRSVNITKDHLKKGHAVVFFQVPTSIAKRASNGSYEPSEHHSYLFKFHNTVSRIAHELYEEGLHVPITPVAFYGGKGINPFRKMTMNIGESVYLDCIQERNSIPKFTDVLEQKVANLLVEAGIPRGTKN